MKLSVLVFVLSSAVGTALCQVPVFISQEVHMTNPSVGPIYFGGETPTGDLYGAYLLGKQVEFGIYQIGHSSFTYLKTDPANTSSGFVSPSISISPIYTSAHAQQLAWISNGGIQTAIGQGTSNNLSVTQAGQLVAGAGTRSAPVVACAQTQALLCAVAFTGVNPPPGLNDFLRGNENVATNASGAFVKPPAIVGGIPNAYADGSPVLVFRGNRLYLGFSGTDQQRLFNIWWSDDYQNYTSATTGLSGVSASLGVQANKLVMGWVDGAGRINIGYWNGDPNGPLSWQGILSRHTGTGDQAIYGTIPTIAAYGNGLALSWTDSTYGLTVALITLP